MQNKKILVVEDEASIRDMLRFALERADFRVSVAQDVPSARLRIAGRRAAELRPMARNRG